MLPFSIASPARHSHPAGPTCPTPFTTDSLNGKKQREFYISCHSSAAEQPPSPGVHTFAFLASLLAIFPSMAAPGWEAEDGHPCGSHPVTQHLPTRLELAKQGLGSLCLFSFSPDCSRVGWWVEGELSGFAVVLPSHARNPMGAMSLHSQESSLGSLHSFDASHHQGLCLLLRL